MILMRTSENGNAGEVGRTGRAWLASHNTLALDDSESLRLDGTNIIALVLIAALYIALRTWRLTSYGLYGDETFSALVAGSDWPQLMDLVISDVVHPPLFYILLKLWVLVGGDSLLWLKLLPLLISLCIIPPFYLLCRELKFKPAAMNLAFFLMTVNAFLINYSQELRMYGLLLALTLTSLWLLVRLFHAEEHAVRIQFALFVTNLLLVYTHYYGWAIVGIELLLLLLLKRQRLVSFLINASVLIVCFAPWGWLVTQSYIGKGGLAQNLGWNPTPGIKMFVGFYAILAGAMSERLWHIGPFYQVLSKAYIGAAILFAIPCALWFLRSVKRRVWKDSLAFWLILTTSFLPVLASFLVSQLLPQSIWAMRYVIISAPTFLLLLALSFTSLSPARLRVLFICMLCGWCALTGLIQEYNRDRTAIEPIARQLMEAEPPGVGVTKLYANPGGENVNLALTIQFYLRKLKETRLSAQLIRDYNEPQEDRFWVVFAQYTPEDRQKIESTLAARGYLSGQPITTKAVTYEIVLVPFRKSHLLNSGRTQSQEAPMRGVEKLIPEQPPKQLVGSERRERVSQLTWCGGGCFDSRRRVNSTVRPHR